MLRIINDGFFIFVRLDLSSNIMRIQTVCYAFGIREKYSISENSVIVETTTWSGHVRFSTLIYTYNKY